MQSGWPASTVLRTHDSYDANGSQSDFYPLGPGGASIVVFDSAPPALRHRQSRLPRAKRAT